jgi:hypothetical protein
VTRHWEAMKSSSDEMKPEDKRDNCMHRDISDDGSIFASSITLERIRTSAGTAGVAYGCQCHDSCTQNAGGSSEEHFMAGSYSTVQTFKLQT